MKRLFGFDPGLVELRRASVTLIAALLSFACASILRATFDLDVNISILAVVLSLTLSRSKPTDWRHTLIEAVELVAVSIIASRVARLFIEHPNVGDALFITAMSGSMWLRRFGSTFARIGTVITLPFIVTLIAPIPVVPGSHFAYWAAPVALMAFWWVNVTRRIAAVIGYIPPLVIDHPKIGDVAKSSNRRVSATSSMALQMLISLTIAFALGRWIYGVHWPWLVLTVYIVNAGSRGRADVIYKGLLRISGAFIGTVTATLMSGLFARGDKWAVVVIFVVMGMAGWLRTANYAYWAAAVTASLALLYGYFGESGVSRLDDRLGGVLIGGLIAVSIAWLVLPVKTTDIFRRRAANALAALSEFLRAIQHQKVDFDHLYYRMMASNADLKIIRPPLRAWQRIIGHRGRHGQTAGKIDALTQSIAVAEIIFKEIKADPLSISGSINTGSLRIVIGNIGRIRVSIKDRVVPELTTMSTSDAPENVFDPELRRMNELLGIFGR